MDQEALINALKAYGPITAARLAEKTGVPLQVIAQKLRVLYFGGQTIARCETRSAVWKPIFIWYVPGYGRPIETGRAKRERRDASGTFGILDEDLRWMQEQRDRAAARKKRYATLERISS
ncbi:hypothetical protein [Candidatus Contendibacter odensensis]|uniref:Uncharacterized protein n=1 Tax=Candidatus Contendobacter odensis Run_B_J11 TaxID=1400861 RepID=A0A7U7GF25_9GAMM|nr:hypothetical protein [Candidatus Contendobacter odensis]CDH46993.1 hypothetical protein BN874_690043 [Candidatus Contendobacter odensis Run_B_J11]